MKTPRARTTLGNLHCVTPDEACSGFKRLSGAKFDERLFGFSKVSPKFVRRAS